MIDSSELLFVVDENNNPIAPKPRSEVHKDGYWHRTSHIIVFNNKKQILCHKRSLVKDTSPGNWDPYFGGHLAPGVSYVDGAIEELKEEVGLIAKAQELKLWKIYQNKTNVEFQGVYIYIWNGDVKTLKFEKDEIDEVAWYAIDEVRSNSLIEKKDKWSKIEYLKDLLEWLDNLKL